MPAKRSMNVKSGVSAKDALVIRSISWKAGATRSGQRVWPFSHLEIVLADTDRRSATSCCVTRCRTCWRRLNGTVLMRASLGHLADSLSAKDPIRQLVPRQDPVGGSQGMRRYAAAALQSAPVVHIADCPETCVRSARLPPA